jgi:23S rRNA (uridine2479-2'-O)-methyltransferase
VLKRIHSKNNDFQRFEVLKRNREKRTRYGEFLVEGVRAINAALQFDWRFEALIYSSQHGVSDWAKDVIVQAKAQQCYDLEAALLQELSDREEPSELLAVVKIPHDDLARIPTSPQMTAVLFDRPGSPGNLGASLRSCDAFGVSGVIISGHAVDLYDSQTVRSSTGSLFAIPAVRIGSPTQALEWCESLRQKGIAIKIIGTDESGKSEISQSTLSGPVLLVMGNETTGMSARYREICDEIVKIPIAGYASSLNVSCATSIALYEISRQRSS